jgi:hypothetical protein
MRSSADAARRSPSSTGASSTAGTSDDGVVRRFGCRPWAVPATEEIKVSSVPFRVLEQLRLAIWPAPATSKRIALVVATALTVVLLTIVGPALAVGHALSYLYG